VHVSLLASQLQTTHERGIVISAGGKYYLPSAVVLLRVLRHNFKCTLPVEIFWLDGSEMDDTTFKVCTVHLQRCSFCHSPGLAQLAARKHQAQHQGMPLQESKSIVLGIEAPTCTAYGCLQCLCGLQFAQ